MLVQLEVTICSPAAVEHLARVAAKGHWRAVRQRHTHCHPRAHMAVFWQNYVRPYAIIRWQKFVVHVPRPAKWSHRGPFLLLLAGGGGLDGGPHPGVPHPDGSHQVVQEETRTWRSARSGMSAGSWRNTYLRRRLLLLTQSPAWQNCICRLESLCPLHHSQPSKQSKV